MYTYIYLLLIFFIGHSIPKPDNSIIIEPDQTLTHETSQITVSLSVKSVFEHLSYFNVPNPIVDKIQDGGLGLTPEATFTSKDGTRKTALLHESAKFELNNYQIKVVKINRSKKTIENIHIQIEKLKKLPL